ncbi:unnamed protein product [Echinostoma caproni]|uniref:CACTA en-spm transposon protein n=1 Tax=Echinostoma caproni TaxID=27848 RepID=A0A183B123_9TREM|nr:unnamed protein product [Echinostoma caproni]
MYVNIPISITVIRNSHPLSSTALWINNNWCRREDQYEVSMACSSQVWNFPEEFEDFAELRRYDLTARYLMHRIAYTSLHGPYESHGVQDERGHFWDSQKPSMTELIVSHAFIVPGSLAHTHPDESIALTRLSIEVHLGQNLSKSRSCHSYFYSEHNNWRRGIYGFTMSSTPEELQDILKQQQAQFEAAHLRMMETMLQRLSTHPNSAKPVKQSTSIDAVA